ncbi:UbiX family flavin prenyltransferase [Pleomorphomonas carboxyditropha]|uniref:Flavin prenyltransferase UbiX n=1 Tax=Pleomorphomonas carboxyditropha TaxID=2023338 RepID=A0A2G9WX89_9HYPH|nr:UbiX family flavin prenyltransferase [Pleomorphomonas carboxyditropha]PIO99316.1 aromatic acid decarboxylase [Pleomorphomonas carboxyditropha]
MRVVVGISGASGAALGREVLRQLGAANVETHLVVTAGGERTIAHELGPDGLAEVRRLATFVHDIDDLGASIASGSFGAEAMAVAPCSMRTLSALAHGFGDNLLTRAGDVMLKERRRLVLLPREAPLTEAHLKSMLMLTRMGAMVAPPVPPFYAKPETIDDMIREMAARVVSWLGVDPGEALTRWQGL